MKRSQPKGELNHALHPRITLYRWGAFYILLIAFIYILFEIVTSQFRTYRIPTGSVELSVPYVTYLVGEPITFTVKNNFDSPIYIPNECPGEPLSVYRYERDTWKRIHAEADLDSCILKDRQIRVAPHSTQNGNYAAWRGLFARPGKYRLVAYVDYFNVAPYQDFEVISKPEQQKVYVQSPRNQTVSGSNGNQQNNTNPPLPPSQSTLTPYSIATTAGSIKVEYSSTYIYVRSITPATSCGYEGGRSGASVEVTFKCPGNETQVQLWLSGGTIRQKIE